MDAKGALAAALDVAALEFTPRVVDDHLDAMAMDTEDALREYLRLFVRVPLVGRLGPLARTFDFVADAAPGVKEILGVGKLAYEVRERHYDLVVVDAEASGHIVAQVAAPRVIGELIQVGMVREQTRWMLDILEDPAADRRRRRHDPRGDARRRDDRAARSTRRRDAASPPRRSSPTACFPRCSTARSPTVVGQPRTGRRSYSSTPPGRACATSSSPPNSPRRDGSSAAGTSSACAAAVPTGLPILYVPELFTRATGRRVVALVAEALGDELDVA